MRASKKTTTKINQNETTQLNESSKKPRAPGKNGLYLVWSDGVEYENPYGGPNERPPFKLPSRVALRLIASDGVLIQENINYLENLRKKLELE